MVWFDFEIPQPLIVENSNKCISFDTRYVTYVIFLEVGSNCDTFKQASENNPDEFRSTCGSKDVAIRIC